MDNFDFSPFIKVRITKGKFKGVVGYVFSDDYVYAPPMIGVFATNTGEDYWVRYGCIKAIREAEE